MTADELGPLTDNAAVRQRILDEIKANGLITFRRFMEIALYLPFDGYYATSRERIGSGSDYLTSPEISALFGYAVARQLGELWRCMGSPARFDVVEVGAGPGTLARELLQWSSVRDQDFYRAIEYCLIDSNEAIRHLQHERLGGWLGSGKVVFSDKLECLTKQSQEGCVLANELMDSFPVHRVTVEQGRLREVYVGVRDSQLTEQTGEPSTPEIEHYFARLGLLPGEGCLAEVNLDTPAWLRTATATLRRGYFLMFDYGYPAERLYAPWRRSGTLHCFYRHSANDNPYVRLGRQDITAHVDFSTLMATARELGLTPMGLVNQNNFLANLGIADSLVLNPTDDLATEEYYTRRRAVGELLDPGGLGRIQALLLSKGAPNCPLSGFNGASAAIEVLERQSE